MNMYISVGSILIGMVIILIYKTMFAVEGSFIILSILGAPLTFFSRAFWIFGDHSKIPFYGMYLLYFLQYQLIAFLVTKLHPIFGAKIYLIFLIIVIPSAILMFLYQMGTFV